jgi:hypothetical protein
MTTKILVMALLYLLAQPGLFAQQDAPIFKFEELKYDFGDILQGKIVEHQFEFVNAGSTPLIISNVITTCGCTAPIWPKDPIKQGEKGTIKIVFNSTGKIGRQNKVVTILSNASNQKERLFIIANVIPEAME